MKKIVENLDENMDLYENYKDSMTLLLKKLTISIPILTISSRVKDKNSLLKKIESKKKYNSIEEITDIVGVRIVTYLPKQINEIVNIIRNEFDVDEANCVDKRIKEVDKFGYSSVHLVVSLNDNRNHLPEYAIFTKMKFEIQVRTVLQHAWAEIEHDIGYKSDIAVPSQIKRKFNMLAGMLELADEEFERLLETISNYRNSIGENIKEIESNGGFNVIELNKDSIIAYIQSSNVFNTIANGILSGFQKNGFSNDLVLDQDVDFFLRICKNMNLDSINQLDKYCVENMETIISYKLVENDQEITKIDVLSAILEVYIVNNFNIEEVEVVFDGLAFDKEIIIETYNSINEDLMKIS